MKRPLLVIAIGYIIGIVWGLYCKCSIALLYAIFGLLYILLKFINGRRKKFKLFSFKRYFRYIKLFLKFNVILVIMIVSIISNFLIVNQNKKYDTLYNSLEDVSLTGIIVSNKTEKEYFNVYKLKVEYLNGSKKYKNTYVLVRVRKNLEIEFGDKIEINGEFIEPSEQRNYKGFSYKDFLKTEKVYGTVNSTRIKVISKNCNNYLNNLSNNVFLRIKDNIEKAMSKEESSLTLGIMLGYTEDITDDVREQFANSSMAHILAVSGMHVTYITVSCMFLLKPILGKRKSKAIIIVILNIYMFIIGFSPSIIRTTIMHTIMLGSGIVYRKNDVWNSIAISSLIILMYNPFLLTSINFLLSYGGVIGIITLNKTIEYLLKKVKITNKKLKYKINRRLAKFIKFIRESFAMSISVNIIIIPIIAIYYHTLGFAFLFTNLFLSLLIGPIIAIGIAIIICAIISANLVKIISIFCIPLLKSLSFLTQIGSLLPLSKIYIVTPNIFEISIYYFFIYFQNFIFKIYMSKIPNAFEFRVRNIVSLLKYKVKLNKNKVVSGIILICIIISTIKILPQNLKIYFIDVGQGDSTLIVTPAKKSILIDGGGSEKEEFDIGKKTLLPYLLNRRISKIDYVIISHFDSDHVGGLLTVMEEIKVGQVIISKQVEDSQNFQKFKQIVEKKKIPIMIVGAKDSLKPVRIQIEKNLYFDIIWPDTLNFISENGLNNNSIVCKLNYKSFSCLFTGDIEELAEKAILKNYKNNLNILNSTVLKVAHHRIKNIFN